jgi:iron complex transport system substrate-binding protein
VRIVSLIASATEIVDALGLGDLQVGRSHECDYPPRVLELPVCTAPVFDIQGDSREIDRRVKETLATAESVYRVFDETLERLKPTHIVTQTQCKVCAVSLLDVERALSARFSTRPEVVALEPNSLDEIYQDILRLARACGVDDRGKLLVDDIKSEMTEIASLAKATGRRPRVINVEWPEPLMAAGNWIPELTSMLGAENLFGAAGLHSPWMQWDDILNADPDVVVCMPCGYDLQRTRAEMHWHDWTRLRAQVFLADGNQYLNRPGPRVAKSLRILAEILYPDSFEPTLEGIGWGKF